MHKTFLLVGLLLVLPLSAVAQEGGFLPPFDEKDQARFRILFPATLRAMFEEGADRTGVFIALLSEMPFFPNFKEEFGITPEQRSRFTIAVNDPELMPEEFRALAEKPIKFVENIDEYLDYVPTEEEEAELELTYRVGFEYVNMRASETFSDEQMQRLDNMVFALTGGLQSPFLSEKHTDALGLTDEQKATFKKINEETKPDRDRMIAAFDAEIQRIVKTGKASIMDVFVAVSKFRDLGMTLKKRRMEVLTRAQIAKATEMAKLPKSMTLPIFDLLPKWIPGPDSWKPGDPVPEHAKPPRGTRQFPKTEE